MRLRTDEFEDRDRWPQEVDDVLFRTSVVDAALHARAPDCFGCPRRDPVE
ncbi:hypothetical protein ABZ446_40235 [Streptomyces sp. NPDC005813]